MDNTDKRVTDSLEPFTNEMRVSGYKKKTKENYKTFKELFEVARNELHLGEFVALKNRWYFGLFSSVHDEASWQDIELLVGELEGLGVERYILGEVFGIDTSSERWLFD